MIDKLKLKVGPAATSAPLEIEVTPITVFVGPNNSGKSRILKEIEKDCRFSDLHGNVLLEKTIFGYIPKDEVLEDVKSMISTEESSVAGHVLVKKVSPQGNEVKSANINFDAFEKHIDNPVTQRRNLSFFYDLYTLRLDGTNRLTLLSARPTGDLKRPPENHLALLFQNNEIRNQVRRLIHEAFGKYFVIDATHMTQFSVRFSDREPINEAEERNWDARAVEFHKAATPLGEMSDGVKAYSGIIATLLAADPRVIMIDEPEAFLHPSLSSKLGKDIGNLLRGSKRRLFASTHSASFVMGCIQSNTPINIVRLTYKNGVGTARVLPKEKLLHLMRHPLLRSTGVLNGLFYESVVVTESDSDRAFYQEINERLLQAKDPRGINNCLFINAQNKQTVWEIVRPLRELGIPVVGIVDVDVFKDGGTNFTKVLDANFLPPITHQMLHLQRKAFVDALNGTGKNWKTGGGIELLSGSDKAAANDFLDHLQAYGAFVIRNGELESWLKPLGATGHGSGWLIDMFTKMGEDPANGNYLTPTAGDVWDFIGSIKAWVENPYRKGSPE